MQELIRYFHLFESHAMRQTRFEDRQKIILSTLPVRVFLLNALIKSKPNFKISVHEAKDVFYSVHTSLSIM